ncbi:MAG: SAM-dependent methyltransferase [Herminiimonas sp.]|nr:SAM-dependent methyltransferase [Herminiimonas sp.]
MSAPVFVSRDPLDSAFWSERFEQQFMPWDRAGVPQHLQQFVARFVAAADTPLATLIPGCGLGHEVAFLADAGWEVCAIDFSAVAVAQARAGLGCWAERVVEADFFTFVPPFRAQLIYERAFLCALPRSMWPQVIERYAALLPAGGLLAGFFFFDANPKGPPFGADPAQLAALLAPHFERIDDQVVTDSVAAFAGRERWQVWQRR